jgi:hypothetical protein
MTLPGPDDDVRRFILGPAGRERTMTISDREMTALHNLADKQAGREVDWISIADARALTELGLARRNRAGWEITAAGLALLKGEAAGPVAVPAEPVRLRLASESAAEGD